MCTSYKQRCKRVLFEYMFTIVCRANAVFYSEYDGPVVNLRDFDSYFIRPKQTINVIIAPETKQPESNGFLNGFTKKIWPKKENKKSIFAQNDIISVGWVKIVFIHKAKWHLQNTIAKCLVLWL